MYAQADKQSRAANPNYLRKPFVVAVVAELAEVLRATKEVVLPLNACVRTARARIATISSDLAIGRYAASARCHPWLGLRCLTASGAPPRRVATPLRLLDVLQRIQDVPPRRTLLRTVYLASAAANMVNQGAAPVRRMRGAPCRRAASRWRCATGGWPPPRAGSRRGGEGRRPRLVCACHVHADAQRAPHRRRHGDRATGTAAF